MATATQDPPRGQQAPDPYSNAFMPDFFARYEAEKAERAAARGKKRTLQRECLDHGRAADYEAKKEKYEYEVTCTYSIPNADDGGELETKTKTLKFSAHSEADAWAMFCDRIKHWPSPHAVEREIKRLAKVN